MMKLLEVFHINHLNQLEGYIEIYNKGDFFSKILKSLAQKEKIYYDNYI